MSDFDRVLHSKAAPIRTQDQLELINLGRPVEDAYRSLVAQQEAYLLLVIQKLEITVAEFVRDYVLEYDTVKFTDIWDSLMNDEYLYQIRQTIRVRKKTPEELKRDQARREADSSTD